jgi:beta-lactamase class D
MRFESKLLVNAAIAFYLLVSPLFAINQTPQSAFIAKQDGGVIMTKGNYDARQAPYSTFKVALTLMGFDAGILENKDFPKMAFKKEYEDNFPAWYKPEIGEKYGWNQSHTPKTFLKNSVLWISHIITKRLGTERFQGYVSKLSYGNRDVSGTPGRNDGLLNSWLGTSLKISPREQVEFLEKLLAHELDLSLDAQEKTREIMAWEEEWDGWKLYGKTGGDNKWFIGWIEKEGAQPIVFAQYLDLTNLPIHKSVGLTAKEEAKREIVNFLRNSAG